MSFLERIDFCHREHARWERPWLVCGVCPTRLNVYEVILEPGPDLYRSSRLAEAWYRETKDGSVRLNIPIHHLDGIHDSTVRGQTLDRVYRSLHLLRELNAPFTEDPPLTRTELNASFLGDFLNILYEHPVEGVSENERQVLHAILQSMHGLLSSKELPNPFETYFDVLVPYVQRCTLWEALPSQPETTGQGGPAEELHAQLYRSHEIRKAFGVYCLPFDLLHVMVACYACSTDMGLVANWALDFLVRICRLSAHRPQRFAETVSRLVHSEISYKRKPHFHKVVRVIRGGEVREHYSTLLPAYQECQAYLRERLERRCAEEVPEPLMDVAFAQNFPAVLFPDHKDYLGFMLGHNHLLTAQHKGAIPKGAYKSAKRIHETCVRLIGRVQEFEKMPMDWTLSTLELFMQTGEIEKEIMEVVAMIMAE